MAQEYFQADNVDFDCGDDTTITRIAVIVERDPQSIIRVAGTIGGHPQPVWRGRWFHLMLELSRTVSVNRNI